MPRLFDFLLLLTLTLYLQATKGDPHSVLASIDAYAFGSTAHSHSKLLCSYSASEENLYQIGCREKAAVFDSIVSLIFFFCQSFDSLPPLNDPVPLQATAVVRDGPSKKIKQAPVFLDLGTNLGYNAIKMGIHAAKCNGHV